METPRPILRRPRSVERHNSRDNELIQGRFDGSMFLEAARKAVIKAMEADGLTRHDLAKRLRGVVARAAVYSFFDAQDVKLSTLAAICSACEVDLSVATNWRARTLKMNWLWHEANERKRTKTLPRDNTL